MLPGLDGYVPEQERSPRPWSPLGNLWGTVQKETGQEGGVGTRQAAFQRGEGAGCRNVPEELVAHRVRCWNWVAKRFLCPLRGEAVLSRNQVTWQPKPPVELWATRREVNGACRTGSRGSGGGCRRYK